MSLKGCSCMRLQWEKQESPERACLAKTCAHGKLNWPNPAYVFTWSWKMRIVIEYTTRCFYFFGQIFSPMTPIPALYCLKLVLSLQDHFGMLYTVAPTCKHTPRRHTSDSSRCSQESHCSPLPSSGAAKDNAFWMADKATSTQKKCFGRRGLHVKSYMANDVRNFVKNGELFVHFLNHTLLVKPSTYGLKELEIKRHVKWTKVGRLSSNSAAHVVCLVQVFLCGRGDSAKYIMHFEKTTSQL